IVLENSSREDKHECPFGRSSIELTKMLCEILKVGELQVSQCRLFHSDMIWLINKFCKTFLCRSIYLNKLYLDFSMRLSINTTCMQGYAYGIDEGLNGGHYTKEKIVLATLIVLFDWSSGSGKAPTYRSKLCITSKGLNGNPEPSGEPLDSNTMTGLMSCGGAEYSFNILQKSKRWNDGYLV
ncbi:hypothetical protein STEG23_026740, partial [Scotinomys teguina]